MTENEVKQLNGFDLEKLQETGETIKENPEAGKLTWRGRLVWDEGFAGNAHVEEIEQLGQVIKRKFFLRGDHPPELLGHNTGSTAVETQIAARLLRHGNIRDACHCPGHQDRRYRC